MKQEQLEEMRKRAFEKEQAIERQRVAAKQAVENRKLSLMGQIKAQEDHIKQLEEQRLLEQSAKIAKERELSEQKKQIYREKQK